MRHFRPAYVRIGSIASKTIGADGHRMSAMGPEADMGFPFIAVLVPGAMRRPRKARHLRCAKSHAQRDGENW